MNCARDKAICDCSKCLHCGLCTSGSQYHRSCYKEIGFDFMAEDNEVSELLARDEELPSEQQEAEAVALQRDTPFSFEEQRTFEENALFSETYQHEMVKTDVDVVWPALAEAYPYEDFNSVAFQRMDLHKYLSSEVTKLEFFVASNQWGSDFAFYPKEIPVRMRKGVVVRHNGDGHDVYHMSCIDTDSAGFNAGGFSKGLLTVETADVGHYFNMMADNPNLFFCKYCEKYMFDCVEHYDGKAWEIPPTDVWPECNHLVHSSTDYQELNYLTLYAHKLIAVVYPQEPPRKKVRRRLFE
uniref:NS3 n=1 Tax=uncultured densovirus TaxID=748192 RepID=A0A7L7YTH8_9VIRU|nr:NS3 [uncultured densovirus]